MKGSESKLSSSQTVMIYFYPSLGATIYQNVKKNRASDKFKLNIQTPNSVVAGIHSTVYFHFSALAETRAAALRQELLDSFTSNIQYSYLL